VDEVFVGEVTKPATLSGVAKDVDTVVTSIGITRQKDGLTYEDVDYQGNVNLLREALKSGVRKFVYVSVLHAEELQDLRIVQAKERFVAELRKSGMAFTVIRPNGYFPDMLPYLDMARRGRAFVFGGGDFRINPISGRDVARKCIDAIDRDEPEVSFGGPAVLTHREIAQEAFDAVGTRAKITSIPTAVAKIGLWFVRRLTPARVYGPIEFAMTVLTRDMVGELSGTDTLRDYFRDQVASDSP
jgi:uncharacterized protein YbjT (DUF2867 family)